MLEPFKMPEIPVIFPTRASLVTATPPMSIPPRRARTEEFQGTAIRLFPVLLAHSLKDGDTNGSDYTQKNVKNAPETPTYFCDKYIMLAARPFESQLMFQGNLF